jgi:hypothetical protein
MGPSVRLSRFARLVLALRLAGSAAHGASHTLLDGATLAPALFPSLMIPT